MVLQGCCSWQILAPCIMQACMPTGQEHNTHICTCQKRLDIGQILSDSCQLITRLHPDICVGEVLGPIRAQLCVGIDKKLPADIAVAQNTQNL